MIPKGTGGEFWETVEKGARAAAEELGVAMRWEGPVSETDTAEHLQPDLVLISISGDWGVFAAAGQFGERCPSASVVLLDERGRPA